MRGQESTRVGFGSVKSCLGLEDECLSPDCSLLEAEFPQIGSPSGGSFYCLFINQGNW